MLRAGLHVRRANYFPSLVSGKVRVCLAEKGAQYAGHHIDLIETGSYGTLSPELLRVNPAGTVPVLLVDGNPVYESHEQIRFIDANFEPRNSLAPPKGTEEHHIMQYWVDKGSLTAAISTKAMAESAGNCIPGLTLPLFMTMIQDIPVHKIAWGLLFHFDKKRPVMFLMMKARGVEVFAGSNNRFAFLLGASRQFMRSHLEEMESWLGTPLGDGRERPFLVGNQFTLADVSFVTIFERLRVGHYESLWADLPRVSAYWDRLQARPSYKTAVLDAEVECIRVGSERVAELKRTVPWFNDLLEGKAEKVRESKL